MRLSVLWALRSLKSSALLGTMRGSATTLTFTALLCLGELLGREGWEPLSSHIWSLRGPRTWEAQWGHTFLGERGLSSARI